LKLHADYSRYLLELREDVKLTEEANDHYKQAIKLEEALPVTNELRLSTALNYSVFLYEQRRRVDLAIEVAKEAFDQALFELEKVEEENMNNTLRVMQLLRDNFELWEVDLRKEKEKEADSRLEDNPQMVKIIMQNRRHELGKLKKL